MTEEQKKEEQKKEEQKKEERTWTEEIEVMGRELVDCIKQLVNEGNVRKVIVRTTDGQVLIELPLTTGVAVGGVVTLMAPVLAALGAIAALLANAKIEVVRTDTPHTPSGENKEPASEPGQPH